MPDVSLTLKVDSGQACIDAVRDSSCDVALTQAMTPQSLNDLQVCASRGLTYDLPCTLHVHLPCVIKADPSTKCSAEPSMTTTLFPPVTDGGYFTAVHRRNIS